MISQFLSKRTPLAFSVFIVVLVCSVWINNFLNIRCTDSISSFLLKRSQLSQSFARRYSQNITKTNQSVIVTLCNDNFVIHAVGLVLLLRSTGDYKGPIVILYTGSQALLEPTFSIKNNVFLQNAVALFPLSHQKPPVPPCERDDEYRKKRISRWDMYYTDSNFL